jgi:serine/threonine-protein kinase
LERRIAVGTWSQIYLARPAGTPRDRPAAYALKMPLAGREGDGQAVELLRHEAAVGRSVVHPHVIAILSASIAEPPYYLVMPWMEGTTLQERLRRKPPLEPRTAIWIARQVASALDGLLEAGWVHGDLKPENVLLARDGHATLLDLGFARPIGAPGSVADRGVLGTPSYMAPEILTSAAPADPRSDLYSLGVLLYEMFSGRLPRDATELGELVRQHRQDAPPPLAKLAPWAPAAVVQLVREMMSQDPLRRPQTPREVAERLMALEIRALAELG